MRSFGERFGATPVQRAGSRNFCIRGPRAERCPEGVGPRRTALEGDDDPGEERITAADRVRPGQLELTLPRVTLGIDHDRPSAAPRDYRRVSVTTHTLSQLVGGG